MAMQRLFQLRSAALASRTRPHLTLLRATAPAHSPLTAAPSTTATLGLRHKSALSRFVESIREQVKENQDFQQNVKQLQDKSSEIADSESVRRAREALEKAKVDAGVQSEKLRKTMEGVKRGADVVGGKVRDVARDIGETKIAQASKETIVKTASAVADTIEKSTEPIRNTQTYKDVSGHVKGYVDETSSGYGGFIPKERRRRSIHDVGEGSANAGLMGQRVKADENAGESVVLHKDSAWKESWKSFKDNNAMMQGLFSLKRSYAESDNAVIYYTREITDRVSDTFSRLFSESESAVTIAHLKETLDPNFDLEVFMRQVREFIVPELLDAYMQRDTETLRLWCSEATFNVLTASLQAEVQQGLVNDSKLLDLRNVDFVSAKILDNDVPVIVVSFNTQEITLLRDRITGNIVHGEEDRIERVFYACVLTKEPEDLHNPITAGWRIIDMAKHDSRPTW